MRPASSNAASARWAGFGWAARLSRPRSRATLQYEAGSARKLSIEETLKGSYRVQRPPSPRNVGIPLSADTPAPVKATPRRAAAISSAARRLLESVTFWQRTRRKVIRNRALAVYLIAGTSFAGGLSGNFL